MGDAERLTPLRFVIEVASREIVVVQMSPPAFRWIEFWAVAR
jgi:hypothetical protein